MIELGLEIIWEGREVKMAHGKKIIREKLDKEDDKEDKIFGGLKSLEMYSDCKCRGEAFYVEEFYKEGRRATARFRWGLWMWQGKKDGEGVRRCPFCKERDGGGGSI